MNPRRCRVLDRQSSDLGPQRRRRRQRLAARRTGGGREELTFRLLGVDPGPVITADTALQMAIGAAELLGANVAVATTGVGGPGRQEGKPQGTVFIAVCTPEERLLCDCAGRPLMGVGWRLADHAG